MSQLSLPRPELVSVQIPFSGFYESQWSRLIDDEESSWIDHISEEPSRYDPALVIVADRGELGDLIWYHSHPSIGYAQLGSDFCGAYLWALADWLDLPAPTWEFEEVSSPKFYNFTTDRLFAKVDAVLLRALHTRLMLVDNSWAFDKAVARLFTSYDGFSSYYDNDPQALKAKPLDEWDHNELLVLFKAWSYLSEDGHEDTLYEDIAQEAYSYHDASLDMPGLLTACRNLVTAWAEEGELGEDEKAALAAPKYRCPDTLELPL